MPIQEGDFVLIQVEDKRFLKRITKDFNLNYKKHTLQMMGYSLIIPMVFEIRR